MDVSLESKSLPSVGYSRKSYLQVTSQKLARDKLVHLHGQRSLALPSVGLAWSDLLAMAISLCFPPCIPDLLMEKDFKASILHVSELPIALPKIPHNSPQSRIALFFHFKLFTHCAQLTGEGSGDCFVKSMGSELSTLALFCRGRPLDLAPLAGLSCGLKEREDLAPLVRAI
ncbi:hypothetical protein CK203_066067 [Vitis vinifera]|uniref:Uncharacterized protein n=1 Tax=Vitis vinifera TaxID=29760 RepID=A0A438FS88_VITVI|nr:hypothetical protein CK203_066067 [Vitis vinifera]